MNALRWILLAAGVALIAGIVIWDRLRRPATRADGRPNFDKTDKHGTDDRLRAVPQLDEAVAVRPRARDPVPPIVATFSAPLDADALPPMHAVGGPAVQAQRDDARRVQSFAADEDVAPIRREPTVDRMSTGAFIAAQALSTQSMRAAMHEAQRQPEAAEAAAAPARTQDAAPAAASFESSARLPKRPPASRKIVALRLSAGAHRVEGSRLKSLLEEANLKHGKYSIYHRLNGDGATLFSVASMVEPGTFDPYAMSGVQFPGVTLFMQLPGPLPGGEMFTQMLDCARALEQAMGGELHDERGLPVNAAREQRIRDDIADFEHLLGRAQA